MIRHDFLEVDFLKTIIKQRQASGEGWPVCVLNVNTNQEFRPEIDGTLSIFSNVKGASRCKVGRQWTSIGTDHYFLSNHEQHYSFAIEGDTQSTETLNIHFGQALVQEMITGMQASINTQLDTPFAPGSDAPRFFERLYERDDTFDYLVRAVMAAKEAGPNASLLLDEKLLDLLSYLLQNHQRETKQVHQLALLNGVAREEIYRRLTRTVDLMHTDLCDSLTLDDLAATASLSKFHFLRLFKQAFRQTPHQFLSHLRVQKASALLRKTNLSIAEIAEAVGYDNNVTFYRSFRKQYQLSPSHFRSQVTN